MSTLSNSLLLSKKNPPILSSSGSYLKTVEHCMGGAVPTNLSFDLRQTGKSSISKRVLTVHAGYGDGRRSSTGNLFIGGFILGGLVIGTLGCVYAPQISRALAGTDKKDIMRKLPKFIYDEDKALEKQRKKLSEKIEQLNFAIDNVSNQMRSENSPNGTDVNSDELEALT
ncbi:hypothetical protein ACH5RR_035349 [Cinchona calisaya]|uniref:Uncharacterized protein n=1 Tax=Cinchona calisaya TaxID=153742 RepID=A0ABD2YEP6_9GENT